METSRWPRAGSSGLTAHWSAAGWQRMLTSPVVLWARPPRRCMLRPGRPGPWTPPLLVPLLHPPPLPLPPRPCPLPPTPHGTPGAPLGTPPSADGLSSADATALTVDDAGDGPATRCTDPSIEVAALQLRSPRPGRGIPAEMHVSCRACRRRCGLPTGGSWQRCACMRADVHVCQCRRGVDGAGWCQGEVFWDLGVLGSLLFSPGLRECVCIRFWTWRLPGKSPCGVWPVCEWTRPHPHPPGWYPPFALGAVTHSAQVAPHHTVASPFSSSTMSTRKLELVRA